MVLSTFTIPFLAILRRILEILIYCFMNSHNEYTERFYIDVYNVNNYIFILFIFIFDCDVVYRFFSIFLLYVYFFGLNYFLNYRQLKKASSINNIPSITVYNIPQLREKIFLSINYQVFSINCFLLFAHSFDLSLLYLF